MPKEGCGQRDGKGRPQEGPSSLPGPGTGSSGGLRAATGTPMWTPCLRHTHNWSRPLCLHSQWSPLYAESINDVTFGAGVSYIGTPRTPSSAKGKFLVSFWADICAAFEVLAKLNLFKSLLEKIEARSQGNDILCLSLPDKP